MVVYINHEFADYMKNYLEAQGFENVRIKAIAILRHAAAVYFKASRDKQYVAWIPRNNKLIVEVYRGARLLGGEFVVVPKRKESHFLYSAKICKIYRSEDGYVRRRELRPGLYSGVPYAVFTVNDERLNVEVHKSVFNKAAMLDGVVA